jgi:PAS domain S-box-containing protein
MNKLIALPRVPFAIAVTVVLGAGVAACVFTEAHDGMHLTAGVRLAVWMLEGLLAIAFVGALRKARRTQDAYHRLFDTSPLPMVAFDAETLRFAAVNQAALDFYGYSREELMPLTMNALKVGDDLAMFRAALSKTVSMDARIVTRHVKRNGTVVDVEVAGRTVSFRGRPTRLAVVVDRTERERLEGELRQAHKMEALGRLAGSVAHDFNNLLMVIMSFSSALLDDTPEDHENWEALRQIHRASERSAELTKQLLAFSRHQPAEARALDVNAAVAELMTLVRRLVGESIAVDLELCDGACASRVDQGQLEQAIVNLVVNARDAMPDGGRLLIATNIVDVPARVAPQLPEHVRAGKFVRLSVSDTGAGMDPATLSRIFEPFFTTKSTGKGTGLGLAIVFGVATRHDGYVDVRTEQGVGTTFELYLPVNGGASATPLTKATGRLAAASAGEMVLVVDDDELVLSAAASTLRRAGYRTLMARHPGEAIVHCEQHTGTIDVLVTDVKMPQMNGRQLAERLRGLRPTLGVVYMSGYTDVVLDDATFVQKPAPPNVLLKAVRAELQRRKNAAA